MSLATAKSTTGSSWLLFFAVGFLLAFTALTVLIWLQPQRDLVDEGLLAELQKGRKDAPGVKTSPPVKTPVASPAAADDWPAWRGPKRDGIYSQTILPSWPEGGPTKLWEVKTGDGFSAPSVAAGRVYLAVQDGDQEAVVCWKADNGEELWRYRYPARFTNEFGNGPRGTPTVAGDLVYTVGGTGLLHCLKTHPASKEGELVWQRDLLKEFNARNPTWGISFSPLALGDVLYINPGGRDGNSIAALDGKTGKTLWSKLDDPGGYSSPLAVTLGGQKQILFFTAAGLVGVVPESGEVAWKFPWRTSYDCNVTTPIVTDDYVFISTGYRRGCTLLKIEKTDKGLEPRQVFENTRMCNHFATCVLWQDHLYGFNDSTLTCLDFRTSKIMWRERGFDRGSLILADGKLVIVGEFGTVALAEASPEAYKEIARFEFSRQRCWTMPVLAQGRLYVRNQKTMACYVVGTE